jgi:hypothetical protein
MSGTQDPRAFDSANEIKRCHIAMGLVCILMLAELCLLSRLDVLYPADGFSDVETLKAGENFAKYGFFRLRFAPVHQIGTPSETPYYYLHYPPLPEIINGALQAIGVRHVFAMRIFCGLFLVLGAVFIYLAFSRITGPVAAVCGLVLFPTTPYFVAFGTSIHTHAYNIFFLGVFFFLFLGGMHRKSASAWRWVLCWLTLFLHSLVSFEFIVYIQAFMWVYALASGGFGKYWRLLVVLATAPAAGVGLHLLQNIWAIGASAAIADGMGIRGPHGPFSAASAAALLKLPSRVLDSSTMYLRIGWPCLAIMTVLIYALREQIGSNMARCGGAFLFAVLSASVTWYVLFPGHAINHRHTVNQLVPLWLIVMGCFVAVVIRIVKQAGQKWARWGVIGVLAVLVINNIYGIKSYFDRPIPLRSVVGRLVGPEGLPEGSACLCNPELQSGFLPYFTHRPFCGHDARISFDQALAKMPLRGVMNPVDYYLYYSEGNYLVDPEFSALASRFPGKKKTLEVPSRSLSAVLILFDLRPGAGVEQERIDTEMREQQLRGLFSPWEIAGFDERLAKEFGE